MNIQTNFNEELQGHLNSLIGKELSSVIFFRDNPVGIFTARFPLATDDIAAFIGERLALIFRMPEDKSAAGVLSFKSNNYDRDCYLMDNCHGGQIWNIDFHYETFHREKRGPRVPRIEGVELYENYSRDRWRAIIPFTSIPFPKIPISKIEVFGMKEYFEDITKVDFDSMSYSDPGAFESFEYPIDVNIVTYVIVSLSEDMFLYIDVTGGIRVSFCNEEQIQQKYGFMKSRKNAFNRPFAKLFYTTES